MKRIILLAFLLIFSSSNLVCAEEFNYDFLQLVQNCADNLRSYFLICLIAIFPFLSSIADYDYAFANQTRSGLEDIQIDPHSGSSSYAVPIAVPQERGGLQPNIALTYNSNNINE